MSLKEDISRILGPEKVSGAPDVLAAHAGDKWYASVLPEAVVFPESTEDVSLLLRYASSMNIPVTARGGGVGYVGGCVPVRGGISLSLERMNRILEISPEDGVAVVEPELSQRISSGKPVLWDGSTRRTRPPERNAASEETSPRTQAAPDA